MTKWYIVLFFVTAGCSAILSNADKPTVGDDKLSTLDILIKFFNGTSPFDNWKVRDGWLTDSDFCTWYGITCYGPDHKEKDKIGHVKEINLPRNYLDSDVPDEIFDLPFLYKLNLSGNHYLRVTLSRLSNARHLRILNLSGVGIWSLSRLGDAPRQLRQLRISRLEAFAPFPEGIYNLRGLRYLDASFNSFGPLSTKIGNLRRLRELHLHNAIIDAGDLPSEIGKLRHLKVLDLGVNEFNGTLPHEAIDRLTHLEALDISQLTFSPTRMEGILPKFSKMRGIRQVNLSNQALSATIPHNFLASAARDIPIVVDLESNQLTGHVPVSLDRFCCMDLFVADNKLASIPEEFCNNEQWMGGRVGQDGCSAIVCPIRTWTYTGRQDGDFPECERCPTYEAFASVAFDHFVGMTFCPESVARDCQRRAQRVATKFVECSENNAEEQASRKRGCKMAFKEGYKSILTSRDCSVDGVLKGTKSVLKKLLNCLEKEEDSDNAVSERKCGEKAVPVAGVVKRTGDL